MNRNSRTSGCAGKSGPTHGGKFSLAANFRVVPILLAIMVSACLQTDPSAPTTDTTSFEDPGPYSGSTSTANFPPVEAGGDEIHWECGKELILRFRESGSPVDIDGKLTLYRAGDIPALHRLKTFQMDFSDAESLVVTSAMVDSLGDSRGTVAFNVLVSNPSQRTGLIMGLSYLRSSGTFSDTNLPMRPPSFVEISLLTHYQGPLLNPDSLPAPTGSEKSILCYYIPGTPYFAKADLGAMLQLEPVASGEFPIRLLRVTPVRENGIETEVEIFEVVGSGNAKAPEFRIGERVARQVFREPVPVLYPD